MASIDELIDLTKKEWETDSFLDKNNLYDEGSKIPNLHSKYLNRLIDAKRSKIVIQHKLEELIEIRKLYFQGKLGKEDLTKYGWEQYNYNASTKAESEKKALTSPEVQKYRSFLEKIEIYIEQLTLIIKSISERNFIIRCMIDIAKFNNGS